MKNLVLALLVLLIASLLPGSLQAQAKGYEKEWKKVDSLADNGLPKSALGIVDKIYSEAKTEKNDPQLIRAVIYRIKLNSAFREDFLAATVRDLEAEVKASTGPSTRILQSILAEIYWKYLQNNQWRFAGRSSVGKYNADSLQTWDLDAITRAIFTNYLASLSDPASLQAIPVSKYMAVIEIPGSGGGIRPYGKMKAGKDGSSSADKETEKALRLRPSLYDFLANRALEYFTSSDGLKTQPANGFMLDNVSFFDLSERFSKLALDRKDQFSVRLEAIRIYRSLEAFHLADKDPSALIDAELSRLDYVRRESAVANRDSLWLDAMARLELAYRNYPAGTAVSFRLAGFYNENAGNRSKKESLSYRVKAMEICNLAIKRFPDSEGAKDCGILAKTIRNPELEILMEQEIIPMRPALVRISAKNIKKLFFRTFKADAVEWQEKQRNSSGSEMKEYVSRLEVASRWEQALPAYADYLSHTMEISLPFQDPGFYVLAASVDSGFTPGSNVFAFCEFTATSYNYISHRNKDGSVTVFVFNRDNGSPAGGITAEAWTRSYNYQKHEWTNRKKDTYTTDKSGFITLPATTQADRGSSVYLRIIWADDILVTRDFVQGAPYNPPDRSVRQTTFFTDRGIYRPGQTVYFKGLLTERKGEDSRILPGEKTRVVFTDVNGSKISEQTFTTSEFGSFNGSFVIPSGLLTGAMTISCENGMTQVQVEEYKRPTFEVSFEELQGNYRLGSEISLGGKALAFAGNAVPGAEVRYRIVRKVFYPFWDRWYYPLPSPTETEIASGKVLTSGEGRFEIKFPALPDPAVARSDKPVFDFFVTADITDASGETRSAEQVVSVGYQSLLLASSVPSFLNLQKDSLIRITASNLNGQRTPKDVAVTIYRLKTPEVPFIRKYWERPDTILIPGDDYPRMFPGFAYGNEDDTAAWKPEEAIFNAVIFTGRDSLVNIRSYADYKGKPAHAKPGVYQILLSADDPSGGKTEVKRYFTVFDPASSQLPGSPVCFFQPLKKKAVPGESALFLIGSKEKNITVMYEVRLRDSLVSRQWIGLSDFMIPMEVPVIASYRGNISVSFVFARNNRIYSNTSVVEVPYPDKTLGFRFETFRSKITPGTKEEWKIQITDPAHPVTATNDPRPTAELLASMYDASLDMFKSASWSFSLYRRFFGASPWDVWGINRTTSGSASPELNLPAYSMTVYPQLNWFGMDYFGGRYGGMMLRSGRMDMVAMDSPAGEKGEPPQQNQVEPGILKETVPEDIAELEKTAEMIARKGSEAGNSKGGLQIRRDFRETAFFYPSLMTDSTGSLTISFTVPDALTRWNFKGFAHNRALDFGFFGKEVVTQKEIMVIPNTPRFVRQGDQVLFSTRVVNLSEGDISASVKLNLADGISLKPADSLIQGSAEQVVNIPKGGTAVVSWSLDIPVNPSLQLLQYTVKAVAGKHTDGEEKLIPVLTNRMMVTESLPLPMKGKGTAEFSMDKLTASSADNTRKNYRLTLEFASNPAWYAVQALPSLNEKQYEDTYSVFGAFYSNSLASGIMQSDPKIKAVFESWKNLSPSALASNLEKNQELKTLLLQQTPWVAEAVNESGNKQRLGMYFDSQNLSANLQTNLTKLKKLQKPGGGFVWFEGMPESRSISQDIIGGLGRLLKMQDTRYMMQDLVNSGIGYIDGEFVRDYNEKLRRYPGSMADNNLNYTEIQYLYARSYFLKEHVFPASVGDALNYYLGQARKYWMHCDLSSQAMLAVALNRFGATVSLPAVQNQSALKETASLIIRSLGERALHSPEMGMYWRAGEGWFTRTSSIGVQAMLIEAFDEVSNDAKSVEEMKIWLLKQKQTTMWESSRATADACYALLMKGAGQLASDPDVQVSLGAVKVDPAKMPDLKTEAGTGYFKISWSGNEIKPSMGKVKVSKGSSGIAWGALYWQYFENLDKITPASTPLKLEKKLFKERNSGSGPVLEALNEGGVLQLGDKVKVRIVLTVDRDLSFVHMRDMRASAFEPYLVSSASSGQDPVSGYRYQDGLGYYQSITDASADFFFDYVPKGTYVFEYMLVVNAAGDYSNGITSVQCMYAPEFSAHSEGIRVKIQK